MAARERIPARVSPVLLLAVLAGCAVGPDFETPALPEGQVFSEADNAVYAAGEPEVAWWETLEDAMLTGFVEQALAENHDIRVAAANVRAARALLGDARLDRFPTVTVDGSLIRQDGVAAQQFGESDRVTVYDAGFDAIWELDFFGHVRRGVEAATAGYEAAIADRHDVAVTIAAEVARAYVELRGAQLRLAVAERNASNQAKSYELTRVLSEAGRGSQLDIARARAQLETTRAGIEPLRAAVRRQVHRLGVLVGEEPTALADRLSGTRPIPALPARIEIGDASGLLRRRADVRGAERRLAAQSARVGVATAGLYPRIRVTGSAGFLSTSADDFGAGASEQTAVGPIISWPAFDLGRVRARIVAETAEADASLARFEKTVLTALEEAENAMVEYLHARDRSERLQVAASASEEAVDLARVRFRSGVDSFLAVLDAERRLLETQDALAQAETETALSYVSLYKALGGGWQES